MEPCSPVPPTKDEETVRPTKDEETVRPTKDKGPVPPTKDEGPVPPMEDEGPVPPTEDEGPVPPTEDEELSQCLSLDSATTESSTPVPFTDSCELLAQSLPVTVPSELLAQSLPVTVPSELPSILSSPSNIPQTSLNYNKSFNDVRKGAFVTVEPDLSAAYQALAIFKKPFLNLPRSKLIKPEIKQDDSNQNSDKNANLNLANYTKETKDERGVDYTKSCLNYNKSSNDIRKGAFVTSKGCPDLSAAGLNAAFPSFLNSSRSKLINPEIKQDDSNQNSDKNANLNFANYTTDERGVDYNCNPNERREEKLISSDENSGRSNDNVKPCLAVGSDIGAFFLEFQSAPSLAYFASQPTLGEQVSDISSKIEKYEEKLKDMNDFLESLKNPDPDK